jgi:hypothetical protein
MMMVIPSETIATTTGGAAMGYGHPFGNNPFNHQSFPLNKTLPFQNVRKSPIYSSNIMLSSPSFLNNTKYFEQTNSCSEKNYFLYQNSQKSENIYLENEDNDDGEENRLDGLKLISNINLGDGDMKITKDVINLLNDDVDNNYNNNNNNNNSNHNNNKMKRKNSIVKLVREIKLEDISKEIISLNEEDEIISKKIKKDKKEYNEPINLNIKSLENKKNNIENRKIFSFTSPKNKINHNYSDLLEKKNLSCLLDSDEMNSILNKGKKTTEASTFSLSHTRNYNIKI